MSDLLQTHETRWFFPGATPPAVKGWFETLGTPDSQPARTDRYLLRVDSSLGVKFREGRLEVKQRDAEYGFHPFSPAVSGRVESWTKWGIEIAADEDPSTLKSGRWLPVTKSRQILYYEFDRQGKVKQIVPGEIPDQGGSLELTAIHARDSFWWSVGVEVIGDVERQFEILLSLLQNVFEQTHPPQLLAEASYSYPHWLEQFSRESP